MQEKFDALIRRLATDQEGERLGVIAAMERLLAANNLTFHDLADSLLPIQRRITTDEWYEMLLRCLKSERLKPFDEGFLHAMRDTYRKTPGWQPTEGHLTMLRDIYEKVCR